MHHGGLPPFADSRPPVHAKQIKLCTLWRARHPRCPILSGDRSSQQNYTMWPRFVK